MRLHLTLLSALALSMVTPVAYAADATAPKAGCGLMQSLTTEQRIMMFTDMRQQTANMTDDQRRQFRRDQRDKFKSMSDADRQKYVADLQAKWDALPADQKTNLQQKADKARSDRPGRWAQRSGC
jgi:hypothetical protein